MAASLDQRFADAMGQLLGPDFPTDIGLAVSGGGDSMAMLTLAHNWARVWGVKLWVVTVDHGLREESAAEAAMVAEECAALGHAHHTLKWAWDGQGNVQARAREARLALINQWRGQIKHVAMAHTRDDVAETLLMRMARGSGVDGLSAMQSVRQVRRFSNEAGEILGDHPRPHPRPHLRPQAAEQKRGAAGQGFEIVRPCLDMGRNELRHYLKTLKGRWVDDPSNDDPKFDRVRIRQLLPELEKNGIGAVTLAQTARRMARAQTALKARAAFVFTQNGRERAGALDFQRAMAGQIEEDTCLRLLSYGLRYVSGHTYAPREGALEAAWESLRSGGRSTLHGCVLSSAGAHFTIYREYNAVKDVQVSAKAGAIWDDVWQMADSLPSDLPGDLTIRALGEEGWRQLTAQLETMPQGAPRHAEALGLPSLWQADTLKACDAFGFGGLPKWGALVRRNGPRFKDYLLSH